MQNGGTIDVSAFAGDMRQVQKNEYPVNQLIRLPLQNVYSIATGEDYSLTLLTSLIPNIAALKVATLPITEAGNFFALQQFGIDERGNLLASAQSQYGMQHADSSSNAESAVVWTGGFIRINGVGPWLLMTDVDPYFWGAGSQLDGQQNSIPYPSGYAVLQMPIAKIEWAGICMQMAGVPSFTPYMLGLLGVNFTAQPARNLVGAPGTYSSPSGSGKEWNFGPGPGGNPQPLAGVPTMEKERTVKP